MHFGTLIRTEFFRTFAKKTIIMKSPISEQARFDTRLPKELKLYMERAAYLGGYRNLTDFIIRTAQEKAKEIIDEKEQVIASEKDSEIFFEAVTNPAPPSETLKAAAEDYKSFISESE